MTDTTATTPLKRTPLRDVHVKAGARMVPFGGWEMPVQYTGIVDEHRAVRRAVGLFDISHMGEFEIDGPDALAIVQRLCTNDASPLAAGQVQYSLLCQPEGGIVDDLTLYRLADDRLMLTVNAANIAKDWSWVTAHGEGEARWSNVSDETALLAVQGPKAEGLVQRLADTDVTRLRYYHFARGAVAGVPALISRTGYTGEDGFELYIPASRAEHLWHALLEAGRGDGIQPIGLGARDTLRLEKGYLLSGQDFDGHQTPLEVNAAWLVKWDRPFVGREALEAQRARDDYPRLVGVRVEDRGIPRHGCAVLSAGTPIGQVTSGTISPSLRVGIALASVNREHAAPQTRVEVDIRGTPHPARVVPLPFL